MCYCIHQSIIALLTAIKGQQNMNKEFRQYNGLQTHNEIIIIIIIINSVYYNLGGSNIIHAHIRYDYTILCFSITIIL